MFGGDVVEHGTMSAPVLIACAARPSPVEAVSPATEDAEERKPGELFVRSASSRRQMETRLRLRRRLLRIDTDTSALSLAEEKRASDRIGTEPVGGKTQQRRASLPSKKTAPVRNNQVSVDNRADDDEEERDDDDENDDEDDEDDDEDDEGESNDGDDGDDEANASTAKSKSEKSEQSSVVKLLFSSSDPCGRPPTVWFDYPLHLQVTRELPASSQDRLVTVNASECELFFKTHWERNCVKNAFAVAGLRRTKKRWSGWHIAWAKHMSRDKFKYLADSQVFSHFPDPWVVGRKDRLTKTLTTYKRRFGAGYAFFPEGFTLPDQLDAFKRANQSSSSSSLWILKPPASACGRGIRVVSARDVDSFLTNKANKERRYVIQKYLANPLLVDGFKFDLRIYVVVTSVDPLRIYLFEEGLTRFCTTPYSLANTRNRFAHLTNYSVNKKNTKFVENSSAESENTGNKWSMSALLNHLHIQGVVKDVAVLREQIKDIIRKTLITAEAHLTPLMHQYVKCRAPNVKCYELFGFDMMLDDACKPWLVEVNVSPSLMAGSPLDKRVKGLLLSDIFHLVGVPVARDTLPPDAIPDPFRSRSDGPTSTPATTTTRATSINKQLHEVVLDPSVVLLEQKHVDLFSANDWQLIHDMDDEMNRLGHFERIFPCTSAAETAKYAPFFTCPRYGNSLCVKWIETRRVRENATATVKTTTGKSNGSTSARERSRSQSVVELTRSKTMTRVNPAVTVPSERLVAQAASR